VTVNTATTLTTGDIALGYWCRLEGGSGNLAEVIGVVTANGITNLFTFEGSLDLLANIPDGL
jgi:hypothetical protein